MFVVQHNRCKERGALVFEVVTFNYNSAIIPGYPRTCPLSYMPEGKYWVDSSDERELW